MRWRREGDAVDIADWLQGLRLEKCAPAFDENAINWDVLSNLTTDDLQEIGGGALPAAPAPVRSSALAEAEIEFTRLSSYGFAKESSGTVQLFGDVPANLDGRAILLVDDIVDTGRSTAFAAAQLRQHGIGDLWTCALLDKPQRREIEVAIDFIGFSIGNVFVVG
jgi:hypothetical protein